MGEACWEVAAAGECSMFNVQGWSDVPGGGDAVFEEITRQNRPEQSEQARASLGPK